MMSQPQQVSSFLEPGPLTREQSLAILHLRRDHLVPVILQSSGAETSGYTEVKVVNTRFGSYPHSTLVDLPWGSQVLATKVTTGSRGYKGGKKRRREDILDEEPVEDDKGAQSPLPVASSGFIHILPPTPETWTLSLPHRTQVVYTPDYSYIIQRLQVRPGDTIIEAGAGSGSFTHAAARAVFNGYPQANGRRERAGRRGKVYSYEYHEPRAEQMRKEMNDHGLNDIVTVTTKDVYKDGFTVRAPGHENDKVGEPEADVVFLDLPAPWLALKHLRRKERHHSSPNQAQDSSPDSRRLFRAAQGLSDTIAQNEPDVDMTDSSKPEHDACVLNPKGPVRLCAFSPCIEQVQRTVLTLRKLGWVEIDMVELMHRRIEVRRERVGLQEEGLRNVNPSAATVEEAVERLREVGSRQRAFHETGKSGIEPKVDFEPEDSVEEGMPGKQAVLAVPKQERLAKTQTAEKERKLFKEGRLIHRSEPEIKTHTSYLTFAVMPCDLTEANG